MCIYLYICLNQPKAKQVLFGNGIPEIVPKILSEIPNSEAVEIAKLLSVL